MIRSHNRHCYILTVWFFMIVLLSACGTTEHTNSTAVIPVDFPFPVCAEGYTVALVASEEIAGQCDLQVCDSQGDIVQQFSCGALAMPVTFRYDDLDCDTCPDLEIFSSECASGLLFPFAQGQDTDSSGGAVFEEEAIEIPYYTEADQNHMLVCAEHADNMRCTEKTIYQLNRDRRRADAVRQWRFWKDTGVLEIWDCLEQDMIFAGEPDLNEHGEPVNADYYNFLLWHDIPQLMSEAEELHTSGMIARPDRNGSGYTGSGAAYTDQQSLLAEYGFEGQTPLTKYRDIWGDHTVELYVDEAAGKALGFVHTRQFTSDLDQQETICCFVVEQIQEAVWEEPDPFDTTAVDGTSGADQVEDYEETAEYTADGRLRHFCAMGDITWLKDAKADGKDILVKMDYIYRDDGTLYYREYHHNGYVFGSTNCAVSSFYDAAGRICHEEGYITHGNILSCYFYDDAGRKPSYCLTLDCGMGYDIPSLTHYQ